MGTFVGPLLYKMDMDFRRKRMEFIDGVLANMEKNIKKYISEGYTTYLVLELKYNFGDYIVPKRKFLLFRTHLKDKHLKGAAKVMFTRLQEMGLNPYIRTIKDSHSKQHKIFIKF